MNLLAMSPSWVVGLLILLLAAAALQDAVQLRISNVTTAAIFVLALVTAAVVGLEIGLWQNAMMFAAVLAIGIPLFSGNILGGGDVKLFAAVALWSDLRGAPMLIAAILICGGILALVILFLRVVVPDRISRRVATLRPRAGIPYGIAISTGTMIATALSRGI
jgi:prepilin peptidase CpaA